MKRWENLSRPRIRSVAKIVDLTFAASTVGHVTPASIARDKKALMIIALSGKLKDMLLAPNV